MAKFTTQEQVSAGGVVFRRRSGVLVEVALIAVGSAARWQLPKGQINPGETPETAALREVREETGLVAALVAPINHVEYGYVSTQAAAQVRFHKVVHFYLMCYRSGDVANHDHEVKEARWVAMDDAVTMLNFENEQNIVRAAKKMIAALGS